MEVIVRTKARLFGVQGEEAFPRLGAGAVVFCTFAVKVGRGTACCFLSSSASDSLMPYSFHEHVWSSWLCWDHEACAPTHVLRGPRRRPGEVGSTM